MIVPQFWAEAKLHQARAAGQRQITVRRFGWSDISQADAERVATERVREAFNRIVAGETLERREPKIPYNGASGVPIREEVLSRHGDAVVTRNAYGAHCLNTPDVLFADIDFADPMGCRTVLISAAVLLAGAVTAGVQLHSWRVGGVAAILALILAYPLARASMKMLTILRGGSERWARSRIDAFVKKHPASNLRVYRTPAGFRVLVMHDVFDAQDTAVTEFFDALGVDRIYATMCRNQKCFRARVSPKPWRIGIGDHMRPRPGVWPVKPERLPQRNAWIQNYEQAATNFAACRFVEAIGSGVVHAKADAVRELHDRLSRALSGLEIA